MLIFVIIMCAFCIVYAIYLHEKDIENTNRIIFADQEYQKFYEFLVVCYDKQMKVIKNKNPFDPNRSDGFNEHEWENEINKICHFFSYRLERYRRIKYDNFYNNTIKYDDKIWDRPNKGFYEEIPKKHIESIEKDMDNLLEYYYHPDCRAGSSEENDMFIELRKL